MNRIVIPLVCLWLAAAAAASAWPQSGAAPATQPLPTGRLLAESPPGASNNLGSMPLNIVISPDGKYAITTGAGYRQQLTSIRISDGAEVGKIEYTKNRQDPAQGLYYGLAFGADGLLYVAKGAHASVEVIRLTADGALEKQAEFRLAASDFPAGLAADRQGRLYVTQNDPANAKTVFGTPASLSIHDRAGKELGRFTFEDALGLSNFPLAVAVTADGRRAYVASERDSAVYALDTADPARIRLLTAIHTGAHPAALLLNRKQDTLYVANAGSDTVSIVDAATQAISGTILLRPQVAKDLAGATPTGLALSESEKMLYVTLGDMNAVAVVDLAEENGPELEGYIPTGWYPTAIARAGRQLLVTNAKGNLPRVPHNFSRGKSVTSPLFLLEGTLWRINIPGKQELEAFTRQSLEDARLTPRYLDGGNPLQSISRAAGKIQHVIYIVKENRTYDQVLGDLPQGNGDPSRCLFPRDITPNQHGLAERFVLLDNFYDSGEVSGDGWTWSTQAHANEYTVRNVPYQYSGRGRVFDYEGTNNEFPTGGFPATGPDGKPLSQDPRFARGAGPVPDVAEAPGGHLWDLARKHGLSYRNYGFFITNGVKAEGKIVTPDNYPSAAGVQPGGRNLDGITDIDFRRFDLHYPDSDAPWVLAKKSGDPSFLWGVTGYGESAAPSRYSEWKREFDLMLARDPSGAGVPALMTVRFGTDHTLGANPNMPTPRCMVADNDFAAGQLVEAVSRSPIWRSTAIIIIEDDAQNGPDHVDAHRSTCYVVSPWIKKGTVDHSFQNTVSAIRTIECLLNLPPMCQYDAAAPVLPGWDDAPRNDAPVAAIFPAESLMKERNPASNSAAPVSPEQPGNERQTGSIPLETLDSLAIASQRMDFDHADRAPADVLNRIIWKTVRGPSSELPPTPHTLGTGPHPDGDD